MPQVPRSSHSYSCLICTPLKPRAACPLYGWTPCRASSRSYSHFALLASSPVRSAHSRHDAYSFGVARRCPASTRSTPPATHGRRPLIQGRRSSHRSPLSVEQVRSSATACSPPHPIAGLQATRLSASRPSSVALLGGDGDRERDQVEAPPDSFIDGAQSGLVVARDDQLELRHILEEVLPHEPRGDPIAAG